MKTTIRFSRRPIQIRQFITVWIALAGCLWAGAAAEPRLLEVGIAVRDITPEVPIRLAGYSSRNRPADKVDHPLLAQAIAWRCESGDLFVMVSLDNCEVSHEFNVPVLKELEEKHGLKQGRVMIVSSHTHSAPILANTLETMYGMPSADRERVRRYSEKLQAQLVAVVADSLNQLKPAVLEYGIGQATFAMNRRAYGDGKVLLKANPDGVAIWDVPVLRIKGTNDSVRAILFGYSCHGTTVRTAEDFYVISGEYMAYARQHLEAMHPGAVAVFITGMGADSDPAPLGGLLAARRHGLELAGAVMGVLDRPMQPVKGPLRMAYEELSLPLADPPSREQIEKDAQSKELSLRNRAEKYLALLNQGKALPVEVKVPVAAVRLGEDLTFIAMGGEVVADYAIRFKRILAKDHPWMIGYAYEVPCYVPTARLILEGGYEVDGSLIFYGYYGPFRYRIEDMITQRVSEMVAGLRRP